MTTSRQEMNTSAIVDALAQVTFTVHDLLTRIAAGHQLSATQLRLLGILRDRTPSMAEIAAHLRLDRSSITGLIDRAEARGLVVRTTSERDARVTTVSLTAAGIELAAVVAAEVVVKLAAVLGAVSDEDQRSFVRLAEGISAV
jgi:DNA-binding MarR family transcriptional regulator